MHLSRWSFIAGPLGISFQRLSVCCLHGNHIALWLRRISSAFQNSSHSLGFHNRVPPLHGPQLCLLLDNHHMQTFDLELRRDGIGAFSPACASPHTLSHNLSFCVCERCCLWGFFGGDNIALGALCSAFVVEKLCDLHLKIGHCNFVQLFNGSELIVCRTQTPSCTGHWADWSREHMPRCVLSIFKQNRRSTLFHHEASHRCTNRVSRGRAGESTARRRERANSCPDLELTASTYGLLRCAHVFVEVLMRRDRGWWLNAQLALKTIGILSEHTPHFEYSILQSCCLLK